MNDYSVL